MKTRWIHPEKARYYQVELVRDLFSDWTLILCWGGLASRRGRMRILAVESEAAGQAQLERIDRRRCQHGYVRVSDGAAEEAEILRGARAASPATAAPRSAASQARGQSLDQDCLQGLDGNGG